MKGTETGIRGEVFARFGMLFVVDDILERLGRRVFERGKVEEPGDEIDFESDQDGDQGDDEIGVC